MGFCIVVFLYRGKTSPYIDLGKSAIGCALFCDDVQYPCLSFRVILGGRCGNDLDTFDGIGRKLVHQGSSISLHRVAVEQYHKPGTPSYANLPLSIDTYRWNVPDYIGRAPALTVLELPGVEYLSVYLVDDRCPFPLYDDLAQLIFTYGEFYGTHI